MIFAFNETQGMAWEHDISVGQRGEGCIPLASQ